jgi:hypothetical protein
MSRLILIDSRVPDVESILETLTPETEGIVFDYYLDTFDTLQSKITKPYTSVAIAQHKYGLPTFQLLEAMPHARLFQLQENDPELTSWSALTAFILWLKSNGAETIDLLACDLWVDENWRYAIQKMRETMHITIRASIDITGSGGNFILESDNVDMVGMYFTPEIVNYKYNFMWSSMSSVGKFEYTQLVLPPENAGIIPATAYRPFIGGLPTTVTPTNIRLLSDISGVVAVSLTDSAVAVLKSDGTVIAYGQDVYGGRIPPEVQSELYNITKIVNCDYTGFAALRSDGAVFVWGTLYDTVTDPYNEFILYNSVKHRLVNIADIWGMRAVLISLTKTGEIITFGQKNMNALLPTNIQPLISSGVVKVITSYGVMLFIKNDGTACNSWGEISNTSYNSNPIVDGFMNNTGAYVIRDVSGGTTQITNVTGSVLLYTMPKGVFMIKGPLISLRLSNVLLSNNVLLQFANASTLPTVINNVTDLTVNTWGGAYLQNNNVVITDFSTGYILNGGTLTHATYGLPTGVSLNNVRRLVSSQSSIGALTFDNKFIWWGQIGHTYASATFPTATAETTAIYNKMSSNVASVYDVGNHGYIVTLLDGSMVSIGITGIAGGTSTTNFSSKNSGKNVYFVPNGSGAVPIDITPMVTSSITPSYQYASTVVSYYNTNPDTMALRGRKYTLYNGTTLISSWYCTADSFTYLFTNVIFETLGNATLSIYDSPDLTTNKSLIGTFTVTITVNSAIIPSGGSIVTNNGLGATETPNPPIITSVVSGTSQAQVYFTAGDMNRSTFVGYKYSTDGVNYYWTNETTSPITITGLTGGISYNVTLKCVSKNAGESVASDASASFMPVSVPSMPTINSIDIGDGTASVYYSDGSSNGSAITMHQYSLDGSNYIDISANSPIVLSGLTNGKPYSVTVKSINSAGPSYASKSAVFVPFTVPSKPIIFNVIPANCQATVYVQHGNDNGADIDTYRYSLNDSPFVTTSNANSCFTITGLTNGTQYYIKVIASNTGGNSLVSEPYLVTPFTIPDPPTNTVIRSINDGISLSFTDGSSNGAPINYYLYSLNGGEDIPAKKNSNGNIHIFNLLNGLNYSVKLKAVNKAGESGYSTEQSFFTRFSRPPAPVVTLITPGNGCAYVHFDETITNVSSIDQLYYSLNGLPIVPVNVSNLTSPLTIPRLFNHRPYNISIASRNGAIISNISNSMPVMVGTPNAPVITNVVPGSKSARVYFDIPFNNGYPITSYRYGLNGNHLSFVKSNVLMDVSGSYLVIQHLINGRNYTIQLCAVNRNGQSLRSNTFGPVKPTQIPNTIHISKVTPYLNGSLITFNQPFHHGSPIIKYKYAIGESNEFLDASGTTLPLAIYNTPINSPFTVRLIATSQAGDSIVSMPSRISTFVYLPPDQIIVKSLTMPSKNSLSVLFSRPAFNGSYIVKYKYALNGSNTYIDASGTKLPLIITDGILPNVDYNIRVIAVNSAMVNNGESVPSLPIAKPAKFTYLAPNKAPVVTSIIGWNRSAIVTLLNTPLRGAHITGYAYSIDDTGSGYTDISGAVSSPLTITGLTNDTLYSIRIAVKTEIGYSPLSLSYPVTPVYKVPETPLITALVRRDQSITVLFKVPFANGAPITGYKYTLNNGVKIPAVLNSDGKSFTITKNIVNGNDVLLIIGTTYTVQMLAVNEVGDSELSSVKLFTTWRMG